MPSDLQRNGLRPLRAHLLLISHALKSSDTPYDLCQHVLPWLPIPSSHVNAHKLANFFPPTTVRNLDYISSFFQRLEYHWHWLQHLHQFVEHVNVHASLRRQIVQIDNVFLHHHCNHLPHHLKDFFPYGVILSSSVNSCYHFYNFSSFFLSLTAFNPLLLQDIFSHPYHTH